MKILSLVAAAAIAALSAGSAQATLIDFDTSAAISPFNGTYSQNGYNITYVSGRLQLVNNNATFGDVLAGLSSAGGSFDLTRSDGGLFSIESFFGSSSLLTSNASVTFSLLGYLAGANTYSQTLSKAISPSGERLVRFDPTPTINKFDRINFLMTGSPGLPVIDNISVTNIAATPTPDPVPVAGVPEPATWAMMVFGFGFIGRTMRRRRHQVAVRYA